MSRARSAALLVLVLTLSVTLLSPERRLVVAASGGPMRVVFHGYVARGQHATATAVLDGTGLSQVQPLDVRDDAELSPDGRSIAFDSCLRSNRRLIIASLDGTAARSLVPLAGEGCIAVRWSRDGRHVSYAGGDHLLHVVDVESGVDTVLPYTYFAPGWHSWSGDGREIVYESGRGGSRHLRIVNLATWETRPLTDALHEFSACEAWAPDWSPASGRIVFTSCRGRLYTIDAGGGDLRAIAPDVSAYAPRWSPDGGSILFLSGGQLMQVADGPSTVALVGHVPYVGGPFSVAPYHP